jgi:hypothetical protein
VEQWDDEAAVCGVIYDQYSWLKAADKLADRWTNRQTDRQTDRQRKHT